MTDKLPPTLLTLFTPRPPLKYLPPCDHASEDRRTTPITGVAQYLQALKDYKEADVYHATESHHQRKERLKHETKERQQHLLTEGIKDCKSTVDGIDYEGLEAGPVGDFKRPSYHCRWRTVLTRLM